MPRDDKRERPTALEARVSMLGTTTEMYFQKNGRLALMAGHPGEKS